MAGATINLAELEQELTRTRALFERWSTSLLARAQDCKSNHVAAIRASKGAARCG